jgi:rhodanese-related sulfurtransferase
MPGGRQPLVERPPRFAPAKFPGRLRATATVTTPNLRRTSVRRAAGLVNSDCGALVSSVRYIVQHVGEASGMFMQRIVGIVALGAVLQLMAGCQKSPPIPAAPAGQFPTVSLRALSDNVVNFPRDFAGHRNVLVLAFDDAQLPSAAEWLSHLRSVSDGRKVWDVPVVGNLPLLEPVIRRSMKSKSPGGSIAMATVPVFVDSSELELALRIPDKKQTWVGVVDSKGRLLGSVVGSWSTQSESLVSQMVVTGLPLASNAALASAGASSAPAGTPPQELTAKELESMLASPGVFVFDNNGPDLYAQGHIPGAKLLEYDNVTADKLPSDRNATLVFYCYNRACGASPAAARAAIALGYTKVFHLTDGITGWRDAGMRTES